MFLDETLSTWRENLVLTDFGVCLRVELLVNGSVIRVQCGFGWLFLHQSLQRTGEALPPFLRSLWSRGWTSILHRWGDTIQRFHVLEMSLLRDWCFGQFRAFLYRGQKASFDVNDSRRSMLPVQNHTRYSSGYIKEVILAPSLCINTNQNPPPFRANRSQVRHHLRLLHRQQRPQS